VKYPALFSRIAALEARSSLRPLTIRIQGGLPDATDKPVEPPGSDLKHQHAVMTGKAPAEPPGSPVGRRWRVKTDQPDPDTPSKHERTGS
jgi:hypothetical protein